jgi:hypothetical protein
MFKHCLNRGFDGPYHCTVPLNVFRLNTCLNGNLRLDAICLNKRDRVTEEYNSWEYTNSEVTSSRKSQNPFRTPLQTPTRRPLLSVGNSPDSLRSERMIKSELKLLQLLGPEASQAVRNQSDAGRERQEW